MSVSLTAKIEASGSELVLSDGPYEILSYVMHTNGTNAGIFEIWDGASSGTEVWQDTLLGTAKGRPFAFPPGGMVLGGGHQAGSITLDISGTGAMVYVTYRKL